MHFLQIKFGFIDFMRLLRTKSNVTLTYKFFMNLAVGKKLENNSWTGVLGYLDRNEADIALGSLDCDIARQGDFDETHWYLNNRISWIVPRAKMKLPTEIIGFFIFQSTALSKTLFVLSFLGVTMATLAASRIEKEKEIKSFKEFIYVLFFLLEIFLSQSVAIMPRATTTRFVVGLWCVFCIFVVFAFHTQVISYFMSPVEDHQIKTMDEILERNLEVTYDVLYDDVVRKLKNGPYMSNLNRPRTPIASLDMTAKGQAATVVDFLRTSFIAQQWLMGDDTTPLYRLEEEPVYFYYVTTVMPKGHFLYEYVNDVCVSLRESGFWTLRWKSYISFRTVKCSVRRQIILELKARGMNISQAVWMYNRAMYDAFPVIDDKSQETATIELVAATEEELMERFYVLAQDKITFEHLRPIFSFYLVGIGISIAVFLAEILWVKILKLKEHYNAWKTTVKMRPWRIRAAFKKYF